MAHQISPTEQEVLGENDRAECVHVSRYFDTHIKQLIGDPICGGTRDSDASDGQHFREPVGVIGQHHGKHDGRVLE